MLVRSLYSYITTWLFVANSTVVYGKVVEMIEEDIRDGNGESKNCFRPVCHYIDPLSRQKKTAASSVCANPPKFNVGDKVELLIDLNKINSIPIENEWVALWGVSAIFGGLGFLFSTFGFLGIFLYKYKLNTSKYSVRS